ncbi:ORF19 [Turkey adenovirus 1]|uniref:ORF19 n=1 Tax=Turkey adenovirus 1 TaxID=878329 RepID=E0YC80_9ADEN|nr:ORF19 [Turkey adenovirus 1]ADM53813.1 ORF19 [Turkey adenovirus 1]
MRLGSACCLSALLAACLLVASVSAFSASRSPSENRIFFTFFLLSVRLSPVTVFAAFRLSGRSIRREKTNRTRVLFSVFSLSVQDRRRSSVDGRDGRCYREAGTASGGRRAPLRGGGGSVGARGRRPSADGAEQQPAAVGRFETEKVAGREAGVLPLVPTPFRGPVGEPDGVGRHGSCGSDGEKDGRGAGAPGAGLPSGSGRVADGPGDVGVPGERQPDAASAAVAHADDAAVGGGAVGVERRVLRVLGPGEAEGVERLGAAGAGRPSVRRAADGLPGALRGARDRGARLRGAVPAVPGARRAVRSDRGPEPGSGGLREDDALGGVGRVAPVDVAGRPGGSDGAVPEGVHAEARGRGVRGGGGDVGGERVRAVRPVGRRLHPDGGDGRQPGAVPAGGRRDGADLLHELRGQDVLRAGARAVERRRQDGDDEPASVLVHRLGAGVHEGPGRGGRRAGAAVPASGRLPGERVDGVLGEPGLHAPEQVPEPGAVGLVGLAGGGGGGRLLLEGGAGAGVQPRVLREHGAPDPAEVPPLRRVLRAVVLRGRVAVPPDGGDGARPGGAVLRAVLHAGRDGRRGRDRVRGAGPDVGDADERAGRAGPAVRGARGNFVPVHYKLFRDYECAFGEPEVKLQLRTQMRAGDPRRHVPVPPACGCAKPFRHKTYAAMVHPYAVMTSVGEEVNLTEFVEPDLQFVTVTYFMLDRRRVQMAEHTVMTYWDPCEDAEHKAFRFNVTRFALTMKTRKSAEYTVTFYYELYLRTVRVHASPSNATEVEEEEEEDVDPEEAGEEEPGAGSGDGDELAAEGLVTATTAGPPTTPAPTTATTRRRRRSTRRPRPVGRGQKGARSRSRRAAETEEWGSGAEDASERLLEVDLKGGSWRTASQGPANLGAVAGVLTVLIVVVLSMLGSVHVARWCREREGPAGASSVATGPASATSEAVTLL